MALKAVLDSLDDLDDDKKALYVEKDGKFYLDLEGVDSHIAVLPLANALKRQKDEKTTAVNDIKKLKDKFKGLVDVEDFDADAVLQMLEDLKDDPDGKKKKNAGDQLLQRRLQTMQTEYDGKLTEKDGKIGKLEATIRDLLVGAGLRSALATAGVQSGLLDAAVALLSPRVSVEQDEDDGKFKAVFQTDLGDLTIEKYVAEWAKTDGAIFVQPAKGGGANGGKSDGIYNGADNPWKAGQVNLTRQGQLMRDRPDEARKYMKAAGISDAMIEQGISAAARVRVVAR